MQYADTLLVHGPGTVSFGCVGGKHRSVALAEEYARIMRLKGYIVEVKHTALEGS